VGNSTKIGPLTFLMKVLAVDNIREVSARKFQFTKMKCQKYFGR